MSLEDNRDESRDEQITEILQVTAPTKITEDQAKSFEIHTHTTTTQHLSEDEEVTDTESQDEEYHSAEIQDSTAGLTTALNAITITPMTSHLKILCNTEVKVDTPSQVTSTLFQKTIHQTSHKLNTLHLPGLSQQAH